MSKQQSWDGWRNHNGCVDPRKWAGYTQRVRVVAWPEGAPPPEDVPLAGTKIRGRNSGNEVFTVETGIPVARQWGWCLATIRDDGTPSGAIRIDELTVVSDEVTATGTVVGDVVVSAYGLDARASTSLSPGTYKIIKESR